MPENYKPGICNIGPAEIRKRKIISFVGYVLFFFLLAVFFIFDVTPILRMSLAVPAFIQSINYLQVTNKFCVNFGLLGIYNFSNDLDKATKIYDGEALIKDRRKAFNIFMQSLIITFMAGIAGYLTSYINFELFF